MEVTNTKYVHTEVDHSLKDPALLVPLFVSMFAPASVCDVGCGIGTFLYTFKQAGVQQVLGLDGHWVNESIRSKYLSSTEFNTVDFEKEVAALPSNFDLCLCLEVAEHIAEDKADAFLHFLTSLSDTIIFSAALPYQGGIHHVNEQKEEYWENKFKKQGFTKFDIIRHQIFSDKNISAHYRRNIVVYSKKNLQQFESIPYGAYAIQENCQQRLYIDLMSGSLSTKKLFLFFVKIFGRKMLRIVFRR